MPSVMDEMTPRASRGSFVRRRCLAGGSEAGRRYSPAAPHRIARPVGSISSGKSPCVRKTPYLRARGITCLTDQARRPARTWHSRSAAPSSVPPELSTCAPPGRFRPASFDGLPNRPPGPAGYRSRNGRPPRRPSFSAGAGACRGCRSGGPSSRASRSCDKEIRQTITYGNCWIISWPQALSSGMSTLS